MTTDSVPYTLSDYVGVLRRRWVYLATILPTAVLGAIYAEGGVPGIRSMVIIGSGLDLLPRDTVEMVLALQVEFIADDGG